MTHDNDQALERYIACVKDLPTLSREAEHDLAVKVRDHDDAGKVDVGVDPAGQVAQAEDAEAEGGQGE